MKRIVSFLLTIILIAACVTISVVGASADDQKAKIIVVDNKYSDGNVTATETEYDIDLWSTIKLTCTIQCPKRVVDGQFLLHHNDKVLRTVKVAMPNIEGAIHNPNFDDETIGKDSLTDSVRMNFSNMKGVDFSTETVLYEVTFKVIAADTARIEMDMIPDKTIILDDMDDVTIVEEAVFKYNLEVVGEPVPETEPAPATEEPTSPVTQETVAPATKPETTPDKGKAEAEEKISDITGTPSVEAADSFIKDLKSDSDPKGSSFAPLKAKSAKETKNAVKIKWAKVKGAKGYIVYGNKCGSKNKKLVTTAKTTFTQKKLKKGTYYKYLVLAYNSKNKVIATSKTIHTATKSGKVTNPKSVKLNAKSSLTIAKNKTKKLKAAVKAQSAKLKLKKHRKLCYESSNTKVVKVNAKGKIKALKKGTATIYAYAQNGVAAKVKVKVK